MADDNSPPQWPTGPGISESDAVSRMESLLNEGTNDAAQPAERPASDDGVEQGPGPRERRADGDEQPESEVGSGSEGGAGEDDAATEGDAGSDSDDPAPDFWSAEDKAWWKQVPAELRPVLKKYEQQRIEFANRKAQDAAEASKKAMEEATKYGTTAEQHAAWWQQNAQRFEQTFIDRWKGVDFNKLSAENPAEWARLSQLRQEEHAMLTQAATQAQESQRIAQERQKQAFEQSKVSEHAKVASKFPDYFGTPEKSAKTYEDLGKFLFSKGIPAERINTIHEAPIIEMALNAMRFEQAQKKASTVTSSGAANNPGNAAPKRIEPGPAQQRGNRNSEAIRQVGERFRKSADISDASELIRLREL